MPKLRNHEAWVQDEAGERFEEYGTKAEGNVVTCYIVSEADKVRAFATTVQFSCSNHADIQLTLAEP